MEVGRADQVVRWCAALLAVAILAAGCSNGNDGNQQARPPEEGWWEDEPSLAPENFEVVADETVDGAGGAVSVDGTEVAVPERALGEDAAVTVRRPLGPIGHEVGGPIVGIEHDTDLDAPVTVRWDVSDLDDDERDSLLAVRWDDRQQRWVPGDVELTVDEDGTASVDLLEWSFWSWVANAGQTGQEIIGRRADAPTCADGPLHDWVAGVVDPDADTNAAAMRVCFENDRDEIVTMRVVNNRTFGQFLHVDGSDGWEWVWGGEDELSAVQAVRAGAAAVFNDDHRIFVPPLHEVAVGIARPDGGGAHFIEFRNESTIETFVADVVTFAMSKLEIPGPGVERVGVVVEAVIECALADVLALGDDPGLEEAARAIVGAVTTCAGRITDPDSDVGLALRGKLSERIARFPDAESAADAMAHDRLLRSVSRVLRLLSVVEVLTYLGDVGAEALVGDLRWSLRGSGRNAPIGEWEPACDDPAGDSNRLYRNLALQDEFADTSIELHDFPRWAEAAGDAVIPLTSCDPGYLAALSGEVRRGWGDREASGIVADAIDVLASGAPPLGVLLSAEIPSLCRHEPARLVDGKDVSLDEYDGYFELQRELRNGSRSWVQLPETPEGPLTAVVATCSAGGVGWPDPILFFGPGGRYRFHTFVDDVDWEDFGMWAPARNGVAGISADGARLVVDLDMYKSDEDGCCYSGYAIVAIEPSGDAAGVAEVLEHGTRIDGVDTPASEPATGGPSSSPTGCRGDDLQVRLATDRFDVVICGEPGATTYRGVNRDTGQSLEVPACAADDERWVAVNDGYRYEVTTPPGGAPTLEVYAPDGSRIVDEPARRGGDGSYDVDVGTGPGGTYC